MYIVYVDSWFWACHSVLMPDGSAEAVHSHNFCVTAKLTAPTLDDRTMAMDFCSLESLLDRITADIADSGNIGRIDYFAKKGQTAEVMAKYIFERLKTSLPDGVTLVELMVAEGPLCRAAYAE